MDLAFNKNEDELKQLLYKVRVEHQRVYKGGGDKKIEAQHKKGKLTARERIAHLLDKDSDHLEIGALAGDGMYEEVGGCPSGGVVAVIGRIHGRQCMVVANDATVKAGAWFPITAKEEPACTGNCNRKPTSHCLSGRQCRCVSADAK